MSLEDTAMSFDEWGEAGYRIEKGAKSRIRGINGVPQFTEDQVYKPKRYWSTYDRPPQCGEEIDHLCSMWDPVHQGLRAIERHCDSVLLKHHPDAFQDGYEDLH